MFSCFFDWLSKIREILKGRFQDLGVAKPAADYVKI